MKLQHKNGTLYEVLIREEHDDEGAPEGPSTWYLIGSSDDRARRGFLHVSDSLRIHPGSVTYRHETFDIAAFNRCAMGQKQLRYPFPYLYYAWIEHRDLEDDGWQLIEDIQSNADALRLTQEE